MYYSAAKVKRGSFAFDRRHNSLVSKKSVGGRLQQRYCFVAAQERSSLTDAMKEESSRARQKPRSEFRLEADIRPQEIAYGVTLMINLAHLCSLFFISFSLSLPPSLPSSQYPQLLKKGTLQ